MKNELFTSEETKAIEANSELIDGEIKSAYGRHMEFMNACHKAGTAFTVHHKFNFTIDGPNVLFSFISPFGEIDTEHAGTRLILLHKFIIHNVAVKTHQMEIQRSDDKTQVLITFAKGISVRTYSCDASQFEAYFAMMDMCNALIAFPFHRMDSHVNDKEQQS